MPFFDFHIHPTLKCLFSDDDAAKQSTKLSPWVPLDKSKIPFILKCCTDFQYILESQGNLSQLAASDCNLVCVALYIPEKDIAYSRPAPKSTGGPLGVYLQKDKINKIIDGNPYTILTEDDWLTLTDAVRFGITNKKVKPIKNAATMTITTLLPFMLYSVWKVVTLFHLNCKILIPMLS